MNIAVRGRGPVVRWVVAGGGIIVVVVLVVLGVVAACGQQGPAPGAIGGADTSGTAIVIDNGSTPSVVTVTVTVPVAQPDNPPPRTTSGPPTATPTPQPSTTTPFGPTDIRSVSVVRGGVEYPALTITDHTADPCKNTTWTFKAVYRPFPDIPMRTEWRLNQSYDREAGNDLPPFTDPPVLTENFSLFRSGPHSVTVNFWLLFANGSGNGRGVRVECRAG